MLHVLAPEISSVNVQKHTKIHSYDNPKHPTIWSRHDLKSAALLSFIRNYLNITEARYKCQFTI
jgi:hypothetical protein